MRTASKCLSLVLSLSIVSTVIVLKPSEVEAAAHSRDEAVAWANAQVGKGLDYDGSYGNQCVDLVYYYVQYLGASSLIGGNACDYASKSLPSGWSYVYSNYQPGDIAVWKTNHSCNTCTTGWAGHVGIIDSADSVGFNAINQNFNESVDGAGVCKKVWFNCSALQCAIRPDWGTIPTPISVSWSQYSTHEIREGKIFVAKTASLSGAIMNDVSDVGIDVYNSAGTYIGGKNEVPDRSGHTYVHIWYDFASELGLSITPGTVYKYSMWVRINNKKYESPRETITCPPVYTVTFDSNGGSSVSSKTVGKNCTISSLPTSTRSGYTFDGWYTAKTGGTKLTTSTKITGNVTYYAHWIAADISSATITSIPNQTYTGSAITPAITVTYSGKTLVKDTDYTVSISNNVNVGTATVTITGKGNYAGTKTATFKIIAANDELVIDDIEDQTYTGSEIEPEITVTCGSKVLKLDIDYTVEYTDNVNAGTATVTVFGTGNYSGEGTNTFKINAKSIVSTTIGSISSQTYTGKAIEPSLTVKDGSIKLISGKDYALSFSSNKNVGTASVVISGKGNYKGTKSGLFSIVAASAEDFVVSAIDDQQFTGTAIKPSFKVFFNSIELTKDDDYVVVYSNNTDIGTATITLVGTGNFKGSTEVTFKIVDNDDPIIPVDPDKTGWIEDEEGDKYYYDETGELTKGWKKIDGKWYYFKTTTGAMVTGWKKLSNKWYYLNSKTGIMTTGAKKIDGKYYLFNTSGVMQKSGWKKDSKGNTYYLKSNGAAYTKKWAKKSGKWYYFGSNGKMVKGKSIKIGKKTYKFKSNGVCKNR